MSPSTVANHKLAVVGAADVSVALHRPEFTELLEALVDIASR